MKIPLATSTLGFGKKNKLRPMDIIRGLRLIGAFPIWVPTLFPRELDNIQVSFFVQFIACKQVKRGRFGL